MADLSMYPGAALCRNCGQMWAMHHTANYTSGPLVGVRVEVCPTAVFASLDGEPHPLATRPGLAPASSSVTPSEGK